MQVRHIIRFAAAAAAGLAVTALAPAAHAALTFNLTPSFNIASGNGLLAYQNFQAAGAAWSELFTDDITINLNIGFTALGASTIGSTSTVEALYSYTSVKAAMLADSKSADDALAAANLPTGSNANTFDMLLNYTSNNPNGVGSATTYVDSDGDANNVNVRMTNANAKALGLLSGTNAAADSSITFNSQFSFDYDRTDGISAGQMDFFGVAVHEIGHAMGFISGVDVLDFNSPNGQNFFRDDLFTYVSPLDLFRYSAASNALGVIDWTADARNKYFSLDGGVTSLTRFSTGVVHGDGRQASHWKDNLNLGIMDPTFDFGELGVVRANDIRAFDVVGYDRRVVVVPESNTFALTLPAFAMLGAAVIRRRKSA